jgi:hypothetical protein
VAFDDAYAAPMDRVLCTVFNASGEQNGIPAPILHPQNGSVDVVLTVITRRPGMDEDFIPGGNPGSNVERLFVSYRDLIYKPQKGDTVTWNLRNFDVFEVTVDQVGGAVLKLRANGTVFP